MSAHYRIVRDGYAGYEVQIWRWWLPFWIEADWCNTHVSVASAERFANEHAEGAKYLGKLPSEKKERVDA